MLHIQLSELQVQQQIVGLLEQRLAAGAASTTEVTAARLALIKTAADLNEARRLRIEARGLVAASLGLPAKAIDGVEFDYDLSPAPAPAAEPASPELRRQALQSRPDILAALAEYAATQSALQLEIARQYPDIHLGAGYQFDQGDSKWSLSITAEIPVLNRNQGPIAEAEARRAEAAARFIALQGRVSAASRVRGGRRRPVGIAACPARNAGQRADVARGAGPGAAGDRPA